LTRAQMCPVLKPNTNAQIFSLLSHLLLSPWITLGFDCDSFLCSLNRESESRYISFCKKKIAKIFFSSRGPHSTDNALHSSPSHTNRGDSIISSSDPLHLASEADICSAVARCHSFPERRDELIQLHSEPAFEVKAQAKVRSPAITYNNTSKTAPREASVLIESVEESKHRTSPQNYHRQSAEHDKHRRHSTTYPGKSATDKAGEQTSRHVSTSLKTSPVTPLGRAHARVSGVSSFFF